MNTEKLIEIFKENLVARESKETEKIVQEVREKYSSLENSDIEDWRKNVKTISLLVKRNAPFSTIIDLSGITIPSNEGKESIVYTTSIVVNRNYLNNVFNKVEDFKRYTGAFLGSEEVLIIRVIRNRRKEFQVFNLSKGTHHYVLVEYKDFFNMKVFNRLVSMKNAGIKIFLIVEGIGLSLLKIIFKTFGIVISSGKNNLKGSLSPTQFNLSRLMLSIFNTSAYKIITQSFYDIDKFVSKPVFDLTERNLELFIKTIIIDEDNLFCFIHSSLKKYKKLKSETNLLLMEKDIEKVNKYIKENPSKFVEVKGRNINKLNSVPYVSKRVIHLGRRHLSYTSLGKNNASNLDIKDSNLKDLNFYFTRSYKINVLNHYNINTRPVYPNLSILGRFLISNNKRYYSSSSENRIILPNYIDNDNAYIFTNIEKILDNNPNDKSTQYEIEKFLYNQGKHILEDNNILGVNVNYLNNDLKKYCFKKADLFKVYLEKKLKIKNIESYINSSNLSKKHEYYLFNIIKTVRVSKVSNNMIYIFLKIVTFHNINSNDQLYNAASSINLSLGKLLVNEYIYSIKDKDVTYSKCKKDFLAKNNTNKLIFTDDFYMYLGAKLSEIMLECGLFNLSSVIYKDETRTVYKIADQVKNFIPVNSVIIAPLKLPMIVEPKPYDIDKLGGYILNDIKYDDSIMTTKIGLKQPSTILDNNIIYSSINEMMKTAFKINKSLLDYLIYYNNEHNLLSLEGDYTYKNVNINNLKGREEKLYQKYLSNRLLYDYTIRIAITYKNVAEIFFPMRMDYRGRLYPTSVYLHYQSSELAKALLLFARPDIIQRSDNVSIDYLKAYGATCFGNKLDKKSYVKRLEWVNDNWDNIINYKNHILLNKAEKKFLFLSFCIEIERFNNFLNDDSTLEFKTYLPIQLDGTCNGYQHLALLSNEVMLYDKLNLDGKSTSKDPSDFYTHVLNKLTIYFSKNARLTKNEKEKESYKRLISLGISRSNIKQAIMTKPYNAKDYTIANYIIDTLFISKKEEYNVEGKTKLRYWYKIDNSEVNFDDIYLLSKCIHEIIFCNYPHIKALVSYLKKISDIMYKLNLPIVWKLPTGLEVNQQYMVTRKKSTRPYSFLDNTLILKITDNIKIDKTKQETALMPNLVHSLDAASLTLLYHTFNKSIGGGVVNFYGVHDCYAVTGKYIDTLISQLRAIYINLYSKEGYISQFDTDIVDYICSVYSLDRKSVFDSDKRLLTMKDKNIEFPTLPNIVDPTTKDKVYEDLRKANMFIK